MNTKDLLYYNEFGGFEKETLNYIIRTQEKNTPMPWSHIIANENFGTIVTSDGGGYTWHGNSRENKITTWSNEAVTNLPSEVISISYDNRTFNTMPRDNLNEYEIRYGFGFAEYTHFSDIIESKLTIYVPIGKSEKVYVLNLKNKSIDNKSVEVNFAAEPVLGVDRTYTKKHLNFKEFENGIAVNNCYRDVYRDEEILFVCDRLAETEVWNQEVHIKSECVLKGISETTLCFRIIVKDSYNLCENNLDFKNETQNSKYTNNKHTNYFDELDEINKFWEEKFNKIKINTPLMSLNIMMNGWLEYQTLVSRLWGRTSFYQAGGAFGFRDQLQDVLMLLYTEPEASRKQILYHAKHQFKEGDVLHWWHPEKDNGIRSRCSDDFWWLPYVTAQYILKTKDYSILDEQIEYVKMDVLKEYEDEKYEVPQITDEKESLYMHAIRAIENGIQFGENGIPNIGSCDWNDGMNNIKGQSVWLGFFVVEVLNKFIPICEYKNDLEKVKKYKELTEELKNTLNTTAWDGKWYKRAFFENGEALGSEHNEECKIDGISQSWAVISGAGEKEKCIDALESLDRNLVDKENMIIKLLTPAFSKSIQNPGYIKAYKEGVRENGGQYTHECCCYHHFLS